MANLELLRSLEHETSKLYKFEAQMDTKQIKTDLIVAKKRHLEGKGRIGSSRKSFYRLDDSEKGLCQKYSRKEKTVQEAIKNAGKAVGKENQISHVIDEKNKKLFELPDILAGNYQAAVQAQTASNDILALERSEMKTKRSKNDDIANDFEEVNSNLNRSIKALKDKILDIAEIISGKFQSKEDLNKHGNTIMTKIDKIQMENHVKRCKKQEALEREQQKVDLLKEATAKIEVLNEQVKTGDFDYASKTEHFESMQKQNLQINEEMQQMCAKISDLMVDWPLKIELQRLTSQLNESLFLEKTLLKQGEQYLEMTAAMENLQMEHDGTSEEQKELENKLSKLQTLKGKVDLAQDKASKIQLEAVAKQNERRFVSAKSGDFEGLVKKIKDKEAHKNNLMEEQKRATKQHEATNKLERSEKEKIEQVRALISRRQDTLKEMKENLAENSTGSNFEAKLEELKRAHKDMTAKYDTTKENLSGKKSFDESLKNEVQLKHQERMKLLEKKFHAMKDELAETTAQLNVYLAKPSPPVTSKTTPMSRPSIQAKSPMINPSAMTKFSPGNVSVNKFFKGVKTARTPTYTTKKVSFTEETTKFSGGKRSSKALNSTTGTKRSKGNNLEPKTPKTSKKLFSSSGYSVFDESP